MVELVHAESLLRIAVNDKDACFRDGQWSAIDALINRRRKIMLVQRTGWGKSSVYFISTRILRDQGAGLTMIVSPLLALMRNQIQQARRLGLNAETINSSNRPDWPGIEQRINSDKIDVLLISPERLANESFVENTLFPIASRMGLLVVDEAHCISDWGHDFRPDYKRIANILRHIPSNTPVLATTATANNRVIDDVKEQLGNLEIQRGTLWRKSLRLQTLRLPDKASRLAWVTRQIPELSGTGIVYVLTVKDAEQVATWLRKQGIDAHPYHSRTEDRSHLEELLQNNEIKVLVATSALGMGYDKPDLSFVIHYQAPGSIISYYQQVGRAGRAISKAYGVLLAGSEDTEIIEYFRRTAFPDENHVKQILKLLESTDGMSVPEIESRLNLRRSQIEKVLKVLSVESPAPLIKDGSKWRHTPVRYRMNREFIERLTRQRELEWEEMQEYIDSRTCLMARLRDALDDLESENCGCCAACSGKPILDPDVPSELLIEAKSYLKRSNEIVFSPRLTVSAGAFPEYGFNTSTVRKFGPEKGRILCLWGDGGLGQLVAEGKKKGRFSNELICAVAEMIEERWNPTPRPKWVACTPSHEHPNLVPDFAERLAYKLRISFVKGAISKIRKNKPQKEQQNGLHQCLNLDGVFSVSDNILRTPVLLVDDIVDSGWTMTVLAVLLRQKGSGSVYPVALASAGPN